MHQLLQFIKTPGGADVYPVHRAIPEMTLVSQRCWSLQSDPLLVAFKVSSTAAVPCVRLGAPVPFLLFKWDFCPLISLTMSSSNKSHCGLVSMEPCDVLKFGIETVGLVSGLTRSRKATVCSIDMWHIYYNINLILNASCDRLMLAVCCGSKRNVSTALTFNFHCFYIACFI